MAEPQQLAFRTRNPDVLTCIANLSNDEVFTPPEFVGAMLDTLTDAWAAANDGASIWADSTLRFLDPCTKSGVFLREIVKRLNEGLSKEIPDTQTRVDHILTNQVFGIGLTSLTSLIARRSVYCSKDATGKHSVAKGFHSASGNIWFEPTQHTWVGGRRRIETSDAVGNPIEMPVDGRCAYCGTAQTAFDRDSTLETHAYVFIHTAETDQLALSLFGADMQFDVVIGNPPYQLDDGGYGASAVAIYDKFVNQAKALEPRMLSMVIPARWFSGGKGLDGFRDSMLQDARLRVIEDFPDSNDVFPGTQIKGGVCYFLWERDNPGNCSIRTHDKGVASPPVERPLLEPGADIFIRWNQAIQIVSKVAASENGNKGSLELPENSRFTQIVSTRKPFGFTTFFQGRSTSKAGDVSIFQNGGQGFVARAEVTKNVELIDSWKVFIPRAGSGSDAYPHSILGQPFVGSPGTVSTETYLCIGPLDSREKCENVISYIATRVFRFLVLLHKPSQDAARGVYTFVPMQDFSKPWTDAELCAKYGFTDQEFAFIESLVRPMELGDD